jgi:hypothetical protein
MAMDLGGLGKSKHSDVSDYKTKVTLQREFASALAMSKEFNQEGEEGATLTKQQSSFDSRLSGL